MEVFQESRFGFFEMFPGMKKPRPRWWGGWRGGGQSEAISDEGRLEEGHRLEVLRHRHCQDEPFRLLRS